MKEFQIKKDRKGSRKSRKLRKLNEYDANTGLFISNVPKTLSKPEFVNILEKAHDSPPLMVDWVGRKGYARVFWHSSELAESMLSSLSNSLGGTDIGTDIKVEKYDPSRNIYFQMLNNNDTSIKISNTESNDEIMAGEEESLKEINDLSIKTVSHENDMNTDENSTSNIDDKKQTNFQSENISYKMESEINLLSYDTSSGELGGFLSKRAQNYICFQ